MPTLSYPLIAMSKSKAPPITTAGAPKVNTSNTAAGEYLLERLRILLNRLQAATDILHKWPEAGGDSGKIHAETATLLIAAIRKIVLSIRTIERHVNGTSNSETTTPTGTIPKEALDAFRKSLDSKCPIPLDLLDLLDVGAIFGMNPQIYARGIMKESMRQLRGLERRKRGLGMLGDAIERGIAKDSYRGNDVNREQGAEMIKHGSHSNDAENDANKELKKVGGDNRSKRKRKDNDDGDKSERFAKKERVDSDS